MSSVISLHLSLFYCQRHIYCRYPPIFRKQEMWNYCLCLWCGLRKVSDIGICWKKNPKCLSFVDILDLVPTALQKNLNRDVVFTVLNSQHSLLGKCGRFWKWPILYCIWHFKMSHTHSVKDRPVCYLCPFTRPCFCTACRVFLGIVLRNVSGDALGKDHHSICYVKIYNLSFRQLSLAVDGR